MYNSQQLGFSTPIIVGAVALIGIVALGLYTARQRTTAVPVVQSHRSFFLRSNADNQSFQPKQPTSYAFSIVDDQGNTVKEYASIHEKIMHVIAVRKDLQEFQHVHPDFDKQTGQFSLDDLTFPSDGQYRTFADFTPMSSQVDSNGQPLGVTLYEDINVGNLTNYKPQALSDTPTTKITENYQIELRTNPTPTVAGQSTTLTFVISQNGTPITNLEKYLGALGHAVVLREGDLEFLHTHALDESLSDQNGNVDFAVTFPTVGRYKAFVQFQHQGKIITTDFVVTAENKGAGTNEGNEAAMPGMDHSMHLVP